MRTAKHEICVANYSSINASVCSSTSVFFNLGVVCLFSRCHKSFW